MSVLPANQKLRRKDAYHMLTLLPLETVTRSLMRGDEWELEELEDFVRRAKALVNAFEARKSQVKDEQNGPA